MQLAVLAALHRQPAAVERRQDRRRGAAQVDVAGRPLPDSITAPARPQIGLSPRALVTGQELARIRRCRFEHSVLNTWAIRPLARSIVTTWPS